MRNYSGKVRNLFYRYWISNYAFKYNIQFLVLIKLSQGQHEIEFAFFISTFLPALKIGNFFFFEMEYAVGRTVI